MGRKNKEKRKNKEIRDGESDETCDDQKSKQNEDEETDPPAEELLQESPRKGEHSEGDSDVEDKPKRKKKKKPIVPTEDTGPKKGQKSIRQMKREKHAQRQADGDSDETSDGQKSKQNENEETDPSADQQQSPRKREHSEDDSDVEDKPKRKKKKKPIVPTENTGPKKGQKSIRQMKREKHAQRQAEAKSVAKDEHKNECLNYLSQWKHNRQNWKFMKAKQVWLLKNKFSTTLIPDVSWPTLVEYFDSARGNIRNLLLEDANKIIKQLDDWDETQNKDEETEENQTEVAKPDDNVYKRARDLIQRLQ